jgi:hypothetical protein
MSRSSLSSLVSASAAGGAVSVGHLEGRLT